MVGAGLDSPDDSDSPTLEGSGDPAGQADATTTTNYYYYYYYYVFHRDTSTDKPRRYTSNGQGPRRYVYGRKPPRCISALGSGRVGYAVFTSVCTNTETTDDTPPTLFERVGPERVLLEKRMI